MKLVEYRYLLKRPIFVNSMGVLLFLIAFIPHLLFLTSFPPGLAHDEIEYQLSAKTFSLQGKDLSGYTFPLNLFATETEGNVSAIPIALLSLFQFFFNQTLLTARLPYLFVSIATAVALYFFVQTIFQKRSISLIAAFIFLINPWAFFLSRFATESPFALLFLLIGITLLLRGKGRTLAVAFFFFFLTFFSYHGAKLIIVPIAFFILLYRYKFSDTTHSRLTLREAALFSGGVLILFIAFLGISQLVPHSNLDRRGGDIMSFNSETTIHIVDNLRKSAIDNPFSSLFVNKYTIGIREVFIRYLTTFSPQVLFFEGDLRAVYAYFYHGLFFLIDSLFLLLGGAFLVKKQLKIFILLFGLALLAPLTSALNQVGTSYVHRSFFLLPILITFISYGIYSLYSVSKKFVPPTITSILIFLILIASYAHFLHFYFFIYPITSGEFYALNNRIVANFARTSSPSQPIEVYTSNPRDAYTAMLYYFDNEQLVRDHLTSVQTFNTTKIYQLKNVSFTYGCPEEKKYSEKTTYIIATDRTCLHGKNPTYTFNNPKDAGPMFFIYNSNLCSDQPIERWRRFKNAKDYHMETMTRESFCQTWVSPY